MENNQDGKPGQPPAKKPTQEFKRPSTTEMQKVGAGPKKSVAESFESGEAPKKPAGDPQAQKALDSSQFYSGAEMSELRNKLPSVWHGTQSAAEEQQAPEGLNFNGRIPAGEVTSADLWKALQPPIVSREDKRSAPLYRQVINQFAAAYNPRYEPDALGKHRAHIFVWDVTRAMNAEVPHFTGAKELTLGQTCDWLRYEGAARGWLKVGAARALEVASSGLPVVVMPRAPKLRTMAMLRPGAGEAGLQVAAAANGRGGSLSLADALGTEDVECFMHP